MTTQISPTDRTDQDHLPPSTDISAVIRHDLFAAIKYVMRPGQKRVAVTGLQLGRHFVFRWIVQLAWRHISANVATADRGKSYTSKELLNWSPEAAAFGETVQGDTDICLSYFAREKMLPLRCINADAPGTKLYQVISQ